jgi:hypothetical protein
LKRVLIAASRLMAVIAVLAIEFAALVVLGRAPDMAVRIGIFGALLMGALLVVCLVLVVSDLVRRGEVSLSRVTFLLVGGTAMLLMVAIANLAPKLFFAYLSNTAGLGLRPNPNSIPAFGFGIGRTTLALTLPLLIPALVAAWMTRGHHLKLLKAPKTEKRARLSIRGVMALVAVTAVLFAVDLAVSRSLDRVSTVAARIGFFGALPMAHILAVYLVLVVSGVQRDGEVALARGVFLLVGGTAIVVLIAVVDVAPSLFITYISDTAGIWVRPGQNFPSVMRFGLGGFDSIDALIVCVVVTPLLLIPALLAGWLTRGYRLELMKRPDAESREKQG